MPQPTRIQDNSNVDDNVDPNEPMVKLPVNVLGSLKSALAKQSNVILTTNNDSNEADQTAETMECENFGCLLKKSVAEISEELEMIEDCLHHPMPPVFHEGELVMGLLKLRFHEQIKNAQYSSYVLCSGPAAVYLQMKGSNPVRSESFCALKATWISLNAFMDVFAPKFWIL